MAKIIMTQTGLDKLIKELRGLKTDKRPLVIARIKAARELGDLSENADYQDAREEQAFIEGRIQELEAMIKSAEISGGGKKGEAALGSKVTLEAGGQAVAFTIVAPNESDPSNGMISYESPIGSALIGQTPGAKVGVKTPDGMVEYKIAKIE